jgi:hypothetical protein
LNPSRHGGKPATNQDTSWFEMWLFAIVLCRTLQGKRPLSNCFQTL